MGTKQEFFLVFHNTSWVMNLRAWNRINYIVLMLGKLLLFYLVNGSNIAASVDAGLLMIRKSIFGIL